MANSESSENMQHMLYIKAVALRDVQTLEHKETTYKGSWKRRGGVGAFMMLARKWDRLENMMQVCKFDIFEPIEADPSGADGTALAEVRDLRQYLLLVEAEMVARSAVKLLPVTGRDIYKNEPTVKHIDLPIPETVLIRHAELAYQQRTPEDGAQHAALVPWVVHGRGYFNLVDPALVETFWHNRAAGIFVLEPHVQSHSIPRSLRDCYYMRGNNWILRIERCPPDVRSYFPSLGREKNMKEHEELPKWQQTLYKWDADGNKYRLSDANEAWHSEDET